MTYTQTCRPQAPAAWRAYVEVCPPHFLPHQPEAGGRRAGIQESVYVHLYMVHVMSFLGRRCCANCVRHIIVDVESPCVRALVGLIETASKCSTTIRPYQRHLSGNHHSSPSSSSSTLACASFQLSARVHHHGCVLGYFSFDVPITMPHNNNLLHTIRPHFRHECTFVGARVMR